MRVPTTCVLLLSGIPATGKSSFGRYLARDHNFAHYDLECHPRGWPHPELKPVWDWSRADFAAQLKVFHPRVALDWGFPIVGISWVRELLAAGVRLVWFAGDIARARELFLKRGGISVTDFDAQVESIQRYGLPRPLECVCVEALLSSGVFKDPRRILEEIFGA
jgi:hypothetical protein